jgi:hypothetical protein
MKELTSKQDFHWYKCELDVKAKYLHEHHGTPDRYPCKVSSEWYDNPNGPYTYYHTFIYTQEVTCDHCGARKVVWPEVE